MNHHRHFSGKPAVLGCRVDGALMGTGCCDVFRQGQPNPNEGEIVASPAGTCVHVYK